MTTRPLVNITPTLVYATSQIGRTIRGLDLYNVAMLANITALARPMRGFRLANLTEGTYVAGYRRSHTAIKQAFIQWTTRLIMPDGVTIAANETLSVTLTITDALGNTSTSAMIPAGFKSETIPQWELTGDPSLPTIFGTGYLDLDAIAAVLTDPSWSFSFAITCAHAAHGYVDTIVMYEIGRAVVDTSDTYGVDPADFQPGQPVGAGSSTTTGLLRLAQTIEGGIATQPDMLVLSWKEDTAATIPKTTSASYAALTNLEQGTGSGTPIRWRVPVRPIYYALSTGGTTAGERARWRVRYYVSGGGTAAIQLLTGATASPYSITGLTGASWQWSAWMDCALPTSGTASIASLSLKAKTTAGTVYISAVSVQSY